MSKFSTYLHTLELSTEKGYKIISTRLIKATRPGLPVSAVTSKQYTGSPINKANVVLSQRFTDLCQWYAFRFKMASYTRIGMSLFPRTTALSVRQCIPLRHAPNVKKKSKHSKDIGKKKKPPPIIIRKPSEIVPPIDPEAITNTSLLEPARRRIVKKLDNHEEERRILLQKEWSRYKMKQHKEDLHRIQEMTRSREDALKELKKSSMYLYLEAIKIDQTLFPVQFNGPTETPPIAGYSAPDLDPDEKRKSH